MNILLVDDHPVVRQGFRRILADVYQDLVVGEAGNGQEALALVRDTGWDLVVLDISMPGRSGLEILLEIHALRPSLPVLMMTTHAQQPYAQRALQAGAAGYVAKGSSRDALVEAVQDVLSVHPRQTTN